MNRESRFALIPACVFLLILACSPIDSLLSSGGSASPADVFSNQIDVWLQATVSLHSATLALTDTFSDGPAVTWEAQMDSVGNLHLTRSLPIPKDLAATPDTPEPGDVELFVIGGKPYVRIGADASAAPADSSYLTALLDTLRSPQGPGLWLTLVPETSYSPAGEETYSGFSTLKYTIDGQVEDSAITGTIWVDQASNALVGADIHVPAALYWPRGSDRSGDVDISLLVMQTTVPAVTLP